MTIRTGNTLVIVGGEPAGQNCRPGFWKNKVSQIGSAIKGFFFFKKKRMK